jgi:hypothetical protein
VSVYVDSLRPCVKNKHWKYDYSCHLFANTTAELLEFAKMIGLKPGWIQRGNLVHFDLNAAKREVAVKQGAIEVSGQFLVDFAKNNS